MKTAIIGAGAMGSLFGAHLAESGQEVTLIDVWQEAVDAINARGLIVEDKEGQRRTVSVRATTDPATIGVAELALVFVKCYHTEEAVRNAAAVIGPDTTVLSLQNGWGNAPRIASVVGQERVLAGVTYHSATVLGPGEIQHAGRGMTFIGELDGRVSDRVTEIAETLRVAGIDVTPTDTVLKAIWSKLALNVCTLPTSALLRFYAGQLIEHEGTRSLMRALLHETVAVAQAQGIGLDEEERWSAITGLVERAKGARASMLQDVERSRRTEIEVVNGAVVAAGRERGISTPHNETMLWLIRSLEETF
jgi:2-dehydropantoate 2-reductase